MDRFSWFEGRADGNSSEELVFARLVELKRVFAALVACRDEGPPSVPSPTGAVHFASTYVTEMSFAAFAYVRRDGVLCNSVLATGSHELQFREYLVGVAKQAAANYNVAWCIIKQVTCTPSGLVDVLINT